MAPKQKRGRIISTKMEKSIVVTVTTRGLKPNLYGKTSLQTKKYIVDDPNNEGQVGDFVLIEEHPPISAKKHWVLKTIFT